MTQKTPVPLIRPAVITRVLCELSQAGALQGLLRRSRLPIDLIDRLNEFVPAHILLHFMAESASYMDSPDLGFRAAIRSHPEQLGRWGHSVAQCYTLRSALQRFCVLYPLEASFVQMRLVEGETHAWLERRRILVQKEPAGEVQGEQTTLGSMIQAVRLAAGSQWNPPAVRIESPKSEWALRAEGLAQSRVDFGGPVLAIAIPNDLLDRRLPRPSPGRTASKERVEPAASDLVGSLLQALVPLATEVRLSLDLGAEIAETTPRTLQRRLAEEHSDWRQVVDRARFEASARLLSDPSLTLNEVSTRLGYSEQAHFTRAFRRWAGKTPSIYRAAV